MSAAPSGPQRDGEDYAEDAGQRCRPGDKTPTDQPYRSFTRGTLRPVRALRPKPLGAKDRGLSASCDFAGAKGWEKMIPCAE